MSRRLLSRSLLLPVAAILILAAGCGEQGPTETALAPAAAGAGFQKVPLPQASLDAASPGRSVGTVHRTLGPEGGEIRLGRVSLSFPAGALAAPTTISAKVSERHLEVKFGPHGLEFPAGLEPVLAFDYSGLSVDEVEALAVYYLGDAGEVLEELDAVVDFAARTVSVKLQHFSVYTVATP